MGECQTRAQSGSCNTVKMDTDPSMAAAIYAAVAAQAAGLPNTPVVPPVMVDEALAAALAAKGDDSQSKADDLDGMGGENGDDITKGPWTPEVLHTCG